MRVDWCNERGEAGGRLSGRRAGCMLGGWAHRRRRSAVAEQAAEDGGWEHPQRSDVQHVVRVVVGALQEEGMEEGIKEVRWR